jgi:hypothetical protein
MVPLRDRYVERSIYCNVSTILNWAMRNPISCRNIRRLTVCYIMVIMRHWLDAAQLLAYCAIQLVGAEIV